MGGTWFHATLKGVCLKYTPTHGNPIFYTSHHDSKTFPLLEGRGWPPMWGARGPVRPPFEVLGGWGWVYLGGKLIVKKRWWPITNKRGEGEGKGG